MDISQGPLHAYGNMGNILNAPGQGQAGSVLVPDPNDDRGPSLFFQYVGFPDIRFWYAKDKVQGYTGVVPGHFDLPVVQSADVIPATFQTNNIAAAQAVTNGTAMTLATAATGIATGIPIMPFTGFGAVNSQSPVTVGIAIDYGFAFGNVISGNKTITVADSTQFIAGMPLVIANVGNAAGTTALLTNVVTLPTPTTITVADAPQATNAAAPIGTGNLWGPSENGFPTPTAALPYLSAGPGLFLDPQQCLQRGLQIVGAAGGTGGNFLVTGYDCYGMLTTQLVTVAAGSNTVYTLKTFKYIVSVVPQFTDLTHNYTVGTADMFGLVARSDKWEYTNIFWAGAGMSAVTGWLAAVTTIPATNLTGDVRGTVQTSAQGGGSGIGTNNSNGTIVSLAMSGRRLMMLQSQPLFNVLRGQITNTLTMYGSQQA